MILMFFDSLLFHTKSGSDDDDGIELHTQCFLTVEPQEVSVET